MSDPKKSSDKSSRKDKAEEDAIPLTEPSPEAGAGSAKDATPGEDPGDETGSEGEDTRAEATDEPTDAAPEQPPILDPDELPQEEPPTTPLEPVEEQGGDQAQDQPADRAEDSSADTQPDSPEDVPIFTPNPVNEEAPTEPDAVARDTPPPTVQPTPAEPQKSGFLPMLLGGVLAAAIGAGAMLVLFPQGLGGGSEAAAQYQRLNAAQEAQQDSIDTALTQVSDLSSRMVAPADLEALQAAIDANAQQLETAIADLSGQLTALDKRLTTVEKTPVEANLDPEITAAYERELKALQDAMAAQRGEVEDMIADATAQKVAASETARKAAQRDALARLEVALAEGLGFEEPLEELTQTGAEVPPVLQEQAEGVPSLDQLKQDYPDAARDALAAARRTEEGTGVGSFLRNQLGVRSLSPKDGDDPDAVLSRAEAALQQAQLEATLDELQTLPEAGQAEMSDWISRARLRADAMAALDDLRRAVLDN